MSQSVFAITMLVSYLLGTYIIFWYGHKMFDYKKDAKCSLFICLIANIILWFLLVLFNTPIVNIVGTIIAYFIVMLTAYNCDWKLSIFHSLLLFAIMNISEFIVLFFVSGLFNLEVNHYENSLIIFVEETFASKFIYFTLLATISSFSKKTRSKDGLMSSILLTILPATTFFITMVFRYQNLYYESNTNTNMLFVLSEIFMFLAIIVVFFIHERTIANQIKLHDMEMVEQKQSINLEYLDILERKDEETRIFIHDIRNNLINISNLTDEESVKSYIQEIYDKSNEISVKAKTKNRLLDVIINKYNLLCKDKNIEFNILSINENLSFISDYDISAILDNLLRNAIERAEKENNPYISLSLESDNKFHKIILKNSCSTKPIEDKNNLVTTKSSKNIHGYGMKSVIKALDNYNGELEWAYNDNEFKIIILIPK
mgnify:CR=1 FL=1